MKGCWTEQVFQCFVPGKICASSGSCAYSLSKKPQNNCYVLHKNNPLAIVCSILNTCVSSHFWAVKGPSTSPKVKTALLFISECLMPNWQNCQRVSEPHTLLKLMSFACPFCKTSQRSHLESADSYLCFDHTRKMAQWEQFVQVCEVLLSLGHSFQALASFKGGVLDIPCMNQSHEIEREKVRFFLATAKGSLLLPT